VSEELRIVATCPKCKSVFDVIKQSNKSSAEQERKQGAVEELEKLGRFIDDWYSAIDGERLTEYYAKRLKEKEGEQK
jgi:hypothetical protein